MGAMASTQDSDAPGVVPGGRSSVVERRSSIVKRDSVKGDTPKSSGSPARRSSMFGRRSIVSELDVAALGDIYQFSVNDIDGNKVNMSTYEGKVLLIVNVASKCGLTKQNYTELNKIYEKYAGQGFEVLAFPCNQFGGQEPGSAEEIKAFKEKREAKYPFFAKVDVKGENAIPLFKWLSRHPNSPGILNTVDLKWNFQKFLIDREGIPVSRIAANVSPLAVSQSIEKELAKPKPGEEPNEGKFSPRS